MSDVPSKEVVDALVNAGWYPGRVVDIKPFENIEAEFFAAARDVLREFGGLHIGCCGRGIECAKSDINVDPISVAHLLKQMRAYELERGVRFFPLGAIHRWSVFLVIDNNGRTYLLDDELTPFASSFAMTLEAVSKPVIHYQRWQAICIPV